MRTQHGAGKERRGKGEMKGGGEDDSRNRIHLLKRSEMIATWTHTIFSLLTASSQMCMPRDSCTSTWPRYCRETGTVSERKGAEWSLLTEHTGRETATSLLEKTEPAINIRKEEAPTQLRSSCISWWRHRPCLRGHRSQPKRQAIVWLDRKSIPFFTHCPPANLTAPRRHSYTFVQNKDLLQTCKIPQRANFEPQIGKIVRGKENIW